MPWENPLTIFRWHEQRFAGDSSETYLSQWWLQQDCTAWNRGLTLSSRAADALAVAPAELPAPFDLVDCKPDVAAVYREWRMRPFDYDYRPPTPLLRGGVLLLRPDLVERLSERFGELEDDVVVDRDDLVAPNGD